MGGAVSAGENNDELIDNLVEADYIKSPSIERVFRAVDRAHYLLPEFKDNAYKDIAWKSGNLHLSAPCIYSEVMESLNLSAGKSFLNLGSGTGYLSTLVGLIIGPTGVNHGVEIHEDVVQYANEKLDDFFGKSSALDEYEFCKPLFVVGNCLNLDTGDRLYDRVYCGAACPENSENFMKQLLNIGGILVMPLNDQLLQIVRISDTVWTAKSVLPVSFASLLSEQFSSKDQTTLPVNEPQTLQDSCRSLIRRTLRHNIEKEHPHLTAKRHTTKETKKRGKRVDARRFRHLVVPLFDDSDSEEPRDPTFREVRQTSYLYSIRRGEASIGEFTAIVELASTVAARNIAQEAMMDEVDISQHSDIEEEEEEEEEELSQAPSSPVMVPEEPTPQTSSGAAILEQRGKIPKREKFDSGLGDDMENGKGLSTSDTENGGDMDVDDSSDNDAVPSPSVQKCASEESSSQMDNQSESSHECALSADSDSATWKHLSTDGDDGDDESEKESEPQSESSTDSLKRSRPGKKLVQEPTSNEYSLYMKLKIQDLPLPTSMKQFINLYREF